MKGVFKVGALMGFVGALAEVGYVSLYSYFGGGSAKEVLSSVTFTFLSRDVAWSNFGVLVGLAIHLSLGVVMGIAIYSLYKWFVGVYSVGFVKKEGDSTIRFVSLLTYSLTALLAIWAINFYVVLPEVNAHFLEVVPPLLALPSKLGFGLFMGLMLSRS